jgi:hypothetical protein
MAFPRPLLSAAGLLLVAALAGCASTPEPAVVSLPYVKSFSWNKPGEGVPDGWKPWTFARFKRPTEYRLIDMDGRTVIRARATDAASGLVHPVSIDPKEFPYLHWHWKVDELIAKADNTQRATEDAPARLVVSFDGDLDSLPMDEQVFFGNVKMVSGQQLPYATLMYIWENRVPRGNIIPNVHTSRIKMIVAESGREKLGSWQEVTRNVYADYRRAFGEEPGRITAIGIMTDTDNTREQASAYYGDIRFLRQRLQPLVPPAPAVTAAPPTPQ